MIKKVFITGITGFVGSHLAEYILENFPEVEILGLFRWRSSKENIEQILNKIDLCHGDLTDLPSLISIMEKHRPDVIFHLAAQSYVDFSFISPISTLQSNVIGTANLLEAVKKLKLSSDYDPIVHICSSSEVYGQVKEGETPIRENNPFRPASPYAVSKVAEDMLGFQYWLSWGIKTIRTRMFTHTGRRRGEVFVESNFAKQIAEIETGLKEPIIKVGNLESVRTFLDVKDAVRAYWTMVEKCQPGEVYNIGGVETMKVGEMLNKLLKLSAANDIKIEIDPLRLRPSDVTLQIPCIDKFIADTGWKPEIKFDKTLEDILNYWRDYFKSKKPVVENGLDLLIVKPGSPKKMYGTLSEILSAIAPPYLGALLAGFIREKGYSVKMIDTEAEELLPNLTADRIIKLNPKLVNILVTGHTPSSSSTPLMINVREILNALRSKNSNIKVILTGIHPSALPENTLKEEKADFIGQGESFYTILELLKALKSNKKEKEYRIDGLCYLEEGKFISNGWGKLIENLDSLPLAAWNLLPMDKYRAHNWHCFGHISERSPYAVFYTSFGCPFNCVYCNVKTLYDGKPGIRYFSPERIIKEIDFLVENYKIKNIQFLDELFAISEERVNGLCDLIIQKGYDLNIWAYARINTVNEKMLQKMKRAGIKWLSYGIESANPKVREGVSKFGFNQESIKRVIKITKDAGIYIMGNFIFGLPDDNFETMRETLDLAKELNCEYVNFYTTMAYPGSQLYEESVLKGTRLPNNWLGYSQLGEETLPLPTKYLSSEEILMFRDRAFEEYYNNPVYLDMIKEKFGVEILEHIREMMKHKIKRKFTKI